MYTYFGQGITCAHLSELLIRSKSFQLLLVLQSHSFLVLIGEKDYFGILMQQPSGTVPISIYTTFIFFEIG